MRAAGHMCLTWLISSLLVELHMALKDNCCVFKILFEILQNGLFLFGISFFILEILRFLYNAN